MHFSILHPLLMAAPVLFTSKPKFVNNIDIVIRFHNMIYLNFSTPLIFDKTNYIYDDEYILKPKMHKMFIKCTKKQNETKPLINMDDFNFFFNVTKYIAPFQELFQAEDKNIATTRLNFASMVFKGIIETSFCDDLKPKVFVFIDASTITYYFFLKDEIYDRTIKKIAKKPIY